MRAVASDGNHIAAAVDAQEQESSSTAMADTAMLGPAPLVEHVDCQRSDLLGMSPVEAVCCRVLELEEPIYGTNVGSSFVCVITN